MLTQIRLKNFKAWRDTGDVPLAPLTVFFGSNSAGKSSISQFLLMLKQTVDSPDRRRVLHFGDKNTVIDLGAFHDVVFRHDEENRLKFSLAWKLEKTLEVSDISNYKRKFYGDSMYFEADIQSKEEGLCVHRLQYTMTNSQLNTYRHMRDRLEVFLSREEKKGKYRLESDNEQYKPVRTGGRSWPLPAPVKFYGFPDEAVAYYQNTGFLPDFSLSLEHAFSRLYYVGPLRGYSERSCLWSGEQPEHVGWRGERTIEAILAAHERRISPGYKKRTKAFEVLAADWLKIMGLIASFEVKPIALHRKDYEVLLKTHPESSEVNLTDAGFGLSQVLPVIVQCFYAPAGATIIFEQPEIHLHPRVQADLADLFIEAIHSRENGRDRNTQLIIESHSEHFLRRLQRRIAEEKIGHEEVAIYICKPGGNGSVMEALEIDEYGNICNWPDNFFGDETGDLVAMTEAAMKRQMEKS